MWLLLVGQHLAPFFSVRVPFTTHHPKQDPIGTVTPFPSSVLKTKAAIFARTWKKLSALYKAYS
jgi:hypothetical protein